MLRYPNFISKYFVNMTNTDVKKFSYFYATQSTFRSTTSNFFSDIHINFCVGRTKHIGLNCSSYKTLMSIPPMMRCNTSIGFTQLVRAFTRCMSIGLQKNISVKNPSFTKLINNTNYFLFGFGRFKVKSFINPTGVCFFNIIPNLIKSQTNHKDNLIENYAFCQGTI